jgi:protein involved in polysaccharide export with SLBB domain
MLDHRPVVAGYSQVSHPQKPGGKCRIPARSLAGFLTPFLLAALGWVMSPSDGLAQMSPDLQQLQRGSGMGQTGATGRANSATDNSSDLAGQNQTFQPQQGLQNPRPLPPSRLEQILSARAGMRLEQFGYDQLGRGQPITVPETGAVQDDYILGPGDEISVSLRGQENTDVRAVVDRNGRVVLPRIAPIAASGRSFGSFRQDVDAAVRRAYVATNASVSIGRIRQISVLVAGEVNVPGLRLVTGLSSVVDAVLLSGGIKKTGTLRNLRVQRGGREYAVDLYSVLTGSGAGANMRLADGDRIVVPPLGRTVAVAGLVRRPGIYELPGNSTSIAARTLLGLAGGEEVRGRYRLTVQRIEADGRLNLVPLPETGGTVRDSEILRVELGADLQGSQATLSGGIGLSGQYAVGSSTRLSDVVRAPGALGTSPYTLFGIIVRKDPRTLLRSLIAFTPAAVLGGGEDMPLQSDDVIRPLSLNEVQLLNFVVRTYVQKLEWDRTRIRDPLLANPNNGQATTTSTTTTTTTSTSTTGVPTAAPETPRPITLDNPFGLAQDTTQTPGQGDARSSVPADLQRANIIALLDLSAPGTPLALEREQVYQRTLLQASQSSATVSGLAAQQSTVSPTQAQRVAMLAALQIGPNDLGRTDTYTSEPAIPQTGAQYEQSGQQMQSQPRLNRPQNQNLPPNFQEQPVAGDSYATNQEVYTFGMLSRQLGVDPLVLVNFLIDHMARLDGAVRGPGTYFVGPGASLNDLVQAAGGTVSWADESGVELLTTAVDTTTGRAASQRQTLPLRQGTLASYVVRPRDQFHFNQVFTDAGLGSVSVQGEVRFAGDYSIRRGEHLSELLLRAGGLTSTAYPQGTVFLRKSAARAEQAGYERAANEIESQLVAGENGFGSNRADPGAVHLFANQLRNQKALGRISLMADPSYLAANPQLDPLLEAGDVVFIPQRPSTITVLGEVMQPGSYSYQPGMTVEDYIKRAGGYAQYSLESMTFIVLPDGSANKMEHSWLSFDAKKLPPGTTIVVPRDLAPISIRQLALDITTILSSFAVTAASLAILAKQ